MTTDSKADKGAAINRRDWLKGGLKAGGALGVSLALPGVATASDPDPLITEIQDWNRYLGDGVDARPYGSPSQFESDVVRRDVSWLTADSKSSINFTPLHELDGIITPSGVCFERHHGGIAEIDKAAEIYFGFRAKTMSIFWSVPPTPAWSGVEHSSMVASLRTV